MSSKIKILCVDQSAWWGGAEICFRDYVAAEKDLDVEFYLGALFPQNHHDQYGISKDRIYTRYQSIKWWMPEKLGNPVRGWDRINKQWRAEKLRQIIEVVKPDIVYFNVYVRRYAWDAEVAKAMGCKVVFHVRMLAHMTGLSKKYLDKADLIIAVSDTVKKEIEATETSSRVVRIYDGVSNNTQKKWGKAEARAKLGISLSAAVACFPAVLSPIKGQEVAIEAWKQVVQDNGEAQLVIAGPVPAEYEEYYSGLKSRAAGYEKNIRFLGFQSDMGLILSASDFNLALTKTGESYGRVPVEAGIAGIPSIVTALGAAPEIVDDGVTGFVVSPNSVEETVEAIRHLMDPSIREKIGQAAHKKSIERFSLEAGISSLREVFHSIM